GEPVAIKVLKSALLSEDLVRRFEIEARIRIDHPNIAQTRDAGVDADGVPFIVLELLDGETLAERFRQPVTPESLVPIALGVCGGLAAAHERGIVHRDIKPSNIFLTSDGTAKLMDFGVALVDDGATKLTRPGAVPGTVGYLSPEQAEGQARVDARSDLWSLGAVLYEGLTGQIPFASDSPLGTLVATLMADLTPLRTINPEIPPALAAIVERALARDREARFDSARSMETALRAVDLDTKHSEIPPAIRQGERRVIALLLARGDLQLDVLEQEIKSRGGTFLRLLGERALGLFGADRWHGDEIQSAADAALACRGAARRVSLSSGWVSTARGQIAGDALEAAERCAEAGLRGVAVDTEAARTLVDSHPLTEVAAGLFELSLSERGSGLATASLPLVGRHAEVGQLEEAIRTVHIDHAPLVALISGPPGIGKSRLLAELEAIAEGKCRTVSVVLPPRSEEKDLSLMRELAAVLLPKDGSDLDIAELLGNPRTAQRHTRALHELIKGSQGGSSAVDLGALWDRSRVAIREWILALARRPLLLSIEDLHHADDASLEILEELVDDAAELPLLIAGTCRAEFLEREPRPFSGCPATVIEVRGLPASSASELANAVAGRELSADTRDVLHERSGGNPFFVIQLVRALDDTEHGEVRLPSSIEATIQSRLDRLPTEERDLCRRVSIWGRPFSRDEATAVGAEATPQQLAALTKRDLLAVRGRRARAKYLFRNSLVAEVAYRSLDASFAAELHRAAAIALASLRGSDPEECARHFDRAGDRAAAGEQYRSAAQVALRRGDARSALRCAEAALDVGVDEEHRFPLRALLVDALRFLGRIEAHAEALERAVNEARTPGQRARILSERAVWLSRRGGEEEALRDAAAAVDAGREGDDPEALTIALGRRSLVLHNAQRPEEARKSLDEAVRRSRDADLPLRALVLGWQGFDVSRRGNLEERLSVFAEQAEVCDELGDLRRGAGAKANLADVYNRLGTYSDAIRSLEEALIDCQRVGHRVMEGYVQLNLAYAHTALGRTDLAHLHLDSAERIAEAAREARLRGLVDIYRARARLNEGAFELAVTAATDALDSKPSRDLEVVAHTVRAQALLELSDAERALADATIAMKMYEELGGLEEDEALVFLAYGSALRLSGQREPAEAVFAKGRARIVALSNQLTDEELRKSFEAIPSHKKLLAER
ncbi:MAG: protein kinase, partial [Myxococcota bacterium]